MLKVGGRTQFSQSIRLIGTQSGKQVWQVVRFFKKNLPHLFAHPQQTFLVLFQVNYMLLQNSNLKITTRTKLNGCGRRSRKKTAYGVRKINFQHYFPDLNLPSHLFTLSVREGKHASTTLCPSPLQSKQHFEGLYSDLGKEVWHRKKR